MKGKRAVIVALLLVGLVLAFPLSTIGQSGITVTGADSVQDTPVTYSQGLVDTTSSSEPRVAVEYSDSTAPYNLIEIPAALQTFVDTVPVMVIVEYANSTTPHNLIEIPAALQALVDTVPAMVIVEYANSTDPHALVDAPAALQALVNTVSRRVIVEYADSIHGTGLVYPLRLMNDTRPPEISGITATGVTTSMATIVWTTDEFADSLVQYGLQSGYYTETAQDSLYVKGHTIELSGLSPETTYYFMVSSTDQSGNSSSSTERHFATSGRVFLPLILCGH